MKSTSPRKRQGSAAAGAPTLTRRTNPERTEATRAALTAAARALFVERGYADTSTPQIAEAAGITRGALYHHYADKRDLLRAVLAAEAEAVARDIDAASGPELGPRDALIAGSAAYLNAMTVPGRTRLLLIDGPAVLGSEAVRRLDDEHAAGSLHEGLQAAMAASSRSGAAAPVRELTVLLSAAFDRAALAIQDGEPPARYVEALTALIDGLLNG